jgi:hypothetical protein
MDYAARYVWLRLAKTGEIPWMPTELAQLIDMPQADLERAVKELERASLVSRHGHPPYLKVLVAHPTDTICLGYQQEELRLEMESGPQKAAVIADPFDAWWGIYPYRQSKATARKAYEALVRSGVRPALITAATWMARVTDHRFRGGREAQYIPLPASWLRSVDWKDATFVTRALSCNWELSLRSRVAEDVDRHADASRREAYATYEELG